MRYLYSVTNCIGSEKAEKFLKNNSLEFKKKNISYMPFTERELLDMDSLIQDGIFDIVNPHSHYIVENKIDYQKLSKKDLIDLIIKNPSILSYPILLQTNGLEPRKLVVGFNSDEWAMFEKNVKSSKYYNNLSKLYKFNNCCFFDEVKYDDFIKSQYNEKR